MPEAKSPSTGNDSTVGERVAMLLHALGYSSQGAMATEMAEIVGTGTTGSRISEWMGGKPIEPASLAAMAMLHETDPRGCLDQAESHLQQERDRIEEGSGSKRGEACLFQGQEG